MHVISEKKLREFWAIHPQAKSSLRAWHRVVEDAGWQTFADIRATYNSVDKVGKCLVFNVAGNKYRIIATWKWDKVYIRFVLTHKQYDQGAWKKDC